MITLPNTTQEFNIKALLHSDIPRVMELQNDVLNAMSDYQKHFFKYRSADMLHKHLDGEMPLHGVFDGASLGAMVMLSYPDNMNASLLEGYPIAEDEKEMTSVVQSLLVAPSIQGQGMASKMLSVAAQFSMLANRPNMMAKIAIDNEKSQGAFLANGFGKTADGVDVHRGYAVTYFSAQAKSIAQSSLILAS
jgi:ribosomal protein S18 acetylase RimI-like enzyme